MAYKKSEETREKIITTARKLFAEKGYEHTDMKTIAGELGMTHAALYYYFKNKTDVALCHQNGCRRLHLAGCPGFVLPSADSAGSRCRL